MGAPMPKLSTRVPKYSRHKQRNLAFVRLDGKQRLLGPYDKWESRAKYDFLIALWIGNGRKLPSDWRQRLDALSLPNSAVKRSAPAVVPREPAATVPDSTTVGEIILQYVQYAKEYYGGNRTYEQTKQICGHLRKLYERLPAIDFGPKEIHELRNQWVTNGWGRKHANDMTKRVIAMFRWAAEKSSSNDSRFDVPVSTWHKLKTVRGLPKGRPLFTFDGMVILDEDGQPIVPVDGKISPPVDDLTVQRTVLHLPAVVADMVRFQRATGCRPGEVCALRPIDINTSADIWLYRPPAHKTRYVESDQGRVVAVGAKGQKILQPYLDRPIQSACFSPRDSERRRRSEMNMARKTPPNAGNKIGSNRSSHPKRQPGESYSVSAYNKAIKRGIARANAIAVSNGEDVIASWSANQLRKAYALEIRNADGLGLDHSQVVLGHKQRATTELWYARNQADDKAVEVAKKIG